MCRESYVLLPAMATLDKPARYHNRQLLVESSNVATFRFPIGKPEVAKFGNFRQAILWLRFEPFLPLLTNFDDYTGKDTTKTKDITEVEKLRALAHLVWDLKSYTGISTCLPSNISSSLLFIRSLSKASEE